MEITAAIINVSSDDPGVSQRMPAGSRVVTVRWLSMFRLPTDHPWVTVRHPDGKWWISVQPPVVFFPPITPQIPTGRGAEAGRWPGSVLWPMSLICATSVDHPAKFNCELKWVKDEHFRSACSGGGRPIFCRWGPDWEQNSPHSGHTIDFSVLGRTL